MVLWESCAGWSAAGSPPWPATWLSACVPPAGAPGCAFGCVPAGEPAASGEVLRGAGALDGGTAPWGAVLCGVVPSGAGRPDAGGANDVGADVGAEVGGVDVGAVDVGAGEGVAVEVVEVEGVGAGEPVERPPDPSKRPFRRPLTPSASAPTATSAAPVGSALPSAAWDAGTPADRTSTAPTAAAAAPRRSPPWILVRERESSDL